MEIQIITAPIKQGVRIDGADVGAKELGEYLKQKEYNVETIEILEDYKYEDEKTNYMDSIIHSTNDLAKKVEIAIKDNKFPLTIGGDHSLGLGTVAGSSINFDTDKFAVIWIDAHGDINTLDSSLSNNIHGMSLASSIGFTDDAMSYVHGFKEKVHADNVYLVGIRDLDEAEQVFADEYKINQYSAKSFNEDYKTVITNILEDLENKNIEHIHLSFDYDVFDPSVLTAVSTPVPNGLLLEDAYEAVKLLLKSNKVRSMDLVEYNPLLSKDDNSNIYEVLNRFLDLIKQA